MKGSSSGGRSTELLPLSLRQPPLCPRLYPTICAAAPTHTGHPWRQDHLGNQNFSALMGNCDPQGHRHGLHLGGLGAAGAGPGGPVLGHSAGQLPEPLPAEPLQTQPDCLSR